MVVDEQSIRLLLVEDDVRTASLLKAYLERHAIEVVHCPSGIAGQQLARNQAFDVVVLDVMLPGIDGLTVCRHIRDHSTVPIIMVSTQETQSITSDPAFRTEFDRTPDIGT